MTPKVSVVTITYNHEEFIAAALDGFVAQQTTFPIEVIVADDGSSDSTPGIVREYADRHPDLFVPILRSENIGIHANLVSALQASRGEYVALCEGDDYWTDPHKLQRQADLLDARPEVFLVAHPVNQVWEAGEAPDIVWPDESQRADLSFSALVRENFLPTNATMSRRLPEYSDIPDIMPLDWYLHLRHARGRDIAMLDDVMAVYRRHAGGAWFGSYADPDGFWVEKAPTMAMFAQAVFDLLRDDPEATQAMQGWTEWVATLVGRFARDGHDAEVARLIDAAPDVVAMMLRSFAQKSESLEWYYHQHEEREADVARLRKRVRKLRRRLRSLTAEPQPQPARGRRSR